MEQAPALLVMAAGMGSRYGGLKQMDAITPLGEVLLDFSVYDALRAGFGKIVLLIKQEIKDDFERLVGSRLRKQCDIEYAFQELDDLPPGFAPPPGRIKPWGTGQAVWAARHVIDRPFAVINADDFYGAHAFRVMHEFLTGEVSPTGYAMVGYRLGNTLTDHGTVARGVCDVENGYLTNITERIKIARRGGAAAFTEDDGQTWSPLELDTLVSMQLFGFHPSLFDAAGREFIPFLQARGTEEKSEYLLPSLLGNMVRSREITLRVLSSNDQWFGVTYADDKPRVMEAVSKLREQGIYPPSLW